VQPTPGTIRSLADDIRSRGEDDLAALLLRRPDLARPLPADLTALAARSATRTSTARALEGLDRAALHVAEAAAVHGGPVRPEGLAPLLGATADEVRPLLEDLWTLALAWRSPDGLVLTRTLTDLLGPHPAGLGPPRPPGREGPPADRVPELAASAPPRAAAILRRLAAGPPVGILGEPGADGVAWLLDRGLLLSADEPGQVVLPRDTGLALRGGVLAEAALRRPAVVGPVHDLAVVDRTAGAAAADLVTRTQDLLGTWESRPPRVLRSGGLSVRDLATAATTVDVPADVATVLVEVVVAAGLVADDGEEEPHWVPTTAYDTWLAAPAGRRWAALALAWLRSTRAPHLVGTRPATGGAPVNALGPGVHWPPVRSLRRGVLDVLAEVGPGTAPAPGAVADALRWARPRRVPRDLEAVVTAVVAEAEVLGVTGRGALAAAGRALLAGPGPEGGPAKPGWDGSTAGGRPPDAEDRELGRLASVAEAHLPVPVDHVLLQADLTAVAPGPPTAGLADLLRRSADVESRGAAAVYRFTEASVRRCLDAGWTGTDLLARLTAASTTPVPQPLEYLVRDVARRHGRVRVGAVRAVVRSDDPAALDAMLADRRLGALSLRRLAPTVLGSPVEADVVLEMLRDEGHAPVAETSAGALAVPAPTRRRATARRSAALAVVRTLDPPTARELVSALRAADDEAGRTATRPGPRIPASDPTTSVALLREAIAERHAVWLGYADGSGATRRMLFYPERLDGGRVTGQADGATRTLSVHRLTGVVAE
jgi:hypothetical protein